MSLERNLCSCVKKPEKKSGLQRVFFQASLRNCINCVHCDDRFFVFISFPQLIYDLFHISLTTPNIVGRYMLRPLAHPVACCCAQFETGQTFQPTTPNISFILWSPKPSTTILDPFARFFQHCRGHARSLRMDYKDQWVVFFPRCTAVPKLVGSCCIRLHTTANTHATTPNIVGATMLGVVASVCTQPKAVCKRMRMQHRGPTTLNIVGSYCVRLYVARSLNGFKLCTTTRNNIQQHATGCANGRNM